MKNLVTTFGNYLTSGSVNIEEDLTLQKVHEIVNHWVVHEITKELFKSSNETKMVFLDNNLVLFYHETKEYFDDEINKIVPSIIIENNYVHGTYLIARMENGVFKKLTEEDIKYLEGCYNQIVVLKQAYFSKKNKNG